MALSAKAQGFRIAVLDPTEDCSLWSSGRYHRLIGDYDDIEAIQQAC